MPYVYLIHPRASVNANESVYKFGKTDDIKQRMRGYDKGSILLLALWVENKDTFETAVLTLFCGKYTQRRDYGTEYFEGNPFQMITDIIAECDKNNAQYTLNTESERTITPEELRKATERKQIEDNEKKHLIMMRRREALITTLNKVQPRDISNMFREVEQGANCAEYSLCPAYNNLKNIATNYMFQVIHGSHCASIQPKTKQPPILKLGKHLEQSHAVLSLCNEAYNNENPTAQQIIERIKVCANIYRH